jgi:hypothetical protein
MDSKTYHPAGYDRDLSDAEWELLKPLIYPADAKRGRGRLRSPKSARACLNAIRYVLKTGCQWFMLPRDFVPKSTTHDALARWTEQGLGLAGTALSLDPVNGIAVDTDENVYFAAKFCVRVLNRRTNLVAAYAGNYGLSGHAGDAALATASTVKIQAVDIAMDRANNLYIADGVNHRVKIVHFPTKVISTFAGRGAVGAGAEINFPVATSAATTFENPTAVFCDRLFQLWVGQTKASATSSVSDGQLRKVY